jgi:ankyrin repeat protein
MKKKDRLAQNICLYRYCAQNEVVLLRQALQSDAWKDLDLNAVFSQQTIVSARKTMNPNDRPSWEKNNEETLFSLTPLRLACYQNHQEIIRLLLDQPSVSMDRVALQIACHYNYSIAPLLQHPKYIGSNLLYGKDQSMVWNPLYEIVYNENRDNLRLLLNHPNFSLMEALTNLEDDPPYVTEILRLLEPDLLPLERHLHTRNHAQETLLHFACRIADAGQAYATVSRLLTFPTIDLHALDESGSTPLHVACAHPNDLASTLVSCLLSNDRSCVNKKNYNGFTPLFIAYEEKKFDLVLALYQNACFNNQPEEDAETTPWLQKIAIDIVECEDLVATTTDHIFKPLLEHRRTPAKSLRALIDFLENAPKSFPQKNQENLAAWFSQNIIEQRCRDLLQTAKAIEHDKKPLSEDSFSQEDWLFACADGRLEDVKMITRITRRGHYPRKKISHAL